MDLDSEVAKINRRLTALEGGSKPGAAPIKLAGAFDSEALRPLLDALDAAFGNIGARLSALEEATLVDADDTDTTQSFASIHDRLSALELRKSYSDEEDVNDQVRGALDSKKPDHTAPAHPGAGTEPSENPNDPARGEAG